MNHETCFYTRTYMNLRPLTKLPILETRDAIFSLSRFSNNCSVIQEFLIDICQYLHPNRIFHSYNRLACKHRLNNSHFTMGVAMQSSIYRPSVIPEVVLCINIKQIIMIMAEFHVWSF